MKKISRRLFLRSIPPAVAVGTVVGVPAVAEAKAELPVTRVNRLAKELSLAMDVWIDDLAYPSIERDIWKAHVYPASYCQYPVSFENIDARPTRTRHAQAIWHMRELERLAIEDGAKSACVFVVGHHYQTEKSKMVLIDHQGNLSEEFAFGMFREGAAS